MNVIICGAGQVGLGLMRYLVQHNYTVTVVDHEPKTINQINERFDARAIQGYASDPLVLKAAGIDNADIIIAVTQSDEINMLICNISNSVYKVPMRIARIRNQLYLDPSLNDLFSNQKLNINYVISPEVEVAQAIAKNLVINGAFNVVKFAHDKFSLIGVKVKTSTPIINTPIIHANSLYPEIDFAIVGIRRNDKSFIVTDQDIVKADDEVYFLVASDIVHLAMPIFGYTNQSVDRVVIIGGGNIGLSLGKILEHEKTCKSVTMIEHQIERAQFIAQHLKQSTIINGDALDQDILNEANVEEADMYIAVTDDDKVNILSTLLAKRFGSGRAMALINRSNFRALGSSLGIDALIFPRVITISKILQSIRERNIKQVYTLGEGFGEVIEIDGYYSNLVGMSVGDVNIHREVKVIGILRENKPIIPSRKIVIKNSDIIIVAVAAHISEATKKMIKI